MSPRRFPLARLGAPLAVLALGLGASACTSTADAADATVAVEGTDTACTPSATTLTAGTIAFALTNRSSKTNELYVKGADGKIRGEVENVGSGTTRTLTVTLKAGDYQLVCKPGEKGDGIAAAVTVTG